MEHYSNEEGTPKEGYLTKQSAIEAMHVMEYKYKEPFRAYQCKICQKWHIGRIKEGKRMDENEKEWRREYRLEVENPQYEGVRTKKDLKNKVIMENTKRILKEEVG